MGFYGNITNTNRVQFVFDKTYPNRKEMDENIAKDGIFVGRYVLVDYDTDTTQSRYSVLYTDTNDYNKRFYFSPDKSNDSLALYTSEPYYLIDEENGVQYINPKRYEEEYAHYLFADEVICVQNGKLYDFYRQVGKNSAYGVGEYAKLEKINAPEDADSYYYNYNEDRKAYGDSYDSTAWQKVFTDGEEKYVMIAELNSVVPTFGITADAPTIVPTIPHFDVDSTNTYYNLHIQPGWGFRVKEAEDEAQSDTKIDQTDYAYDTEQKKPVLVRQNYNGAIYFNKDGFNSDIRIEKENSDDGISILPTGKSGNLYNSVWNHSTGYTTKSEAEDIQELSIYLPSIGNAVSQMWDIVYGQGDETAEENKFRRNKNIDWNSLAGERLVTVNDDGSGFEYNEDKIDTLAGCINSVHDLMGMIITEEKRKSPLVESEEEYQKRISIENALANRIYYGAYDESKPDYKSYFIKDLTYEFTPSETGSVEEVQLSDFSAKDYYYITNSNYYLEKTGYQNGNKYYLLDGKIFVKAITTIDYEPNKFYYKNDLGDYVIETLKVPDELKVYYSIEPGFKTTVSAENRTFFYPEQVDYLNRLVEYLNNKSTTVANKNDAGLYLWSEAGDRTGLYHGNGLFYLDQDENGLPVYRPFKIDQNNGYTQTLRWYENFIIEPAIDTNGKDVSVYDFDKGATYYDIALVQFENDKFYYEVPKEDGTTEYIYLDYLDNAKPETVYKVFEDDKITQVTGTMLWSYNEDEEKVEMDVDFYQPDKYFYKEGDDYILAKEQNRVNRRYFIIGTPKEATDLFYTPNKYYFNKNGEYIIDQSETMTEGRQYYNVYELYVIDGNDILDNYSKWNTNVTKVPDGIVLGTRKEVYKWKELKGFARTLNTIHGLILNINNLIKFNDKITRDTTTVQGCINTMNDIINKFDKIVPGNLLIVDQYGMINTASGGGDNWIGVEIDPEGETIEFNHKNPVEGDAEAVAAVNPLFGESFELTDHYFDAKGHKFATKNHTVTLPKGNYEDSSKVNGQKVITNLEFEPTTGAITSNSANLGDVLIAENETLSSRLSTLQDNIDQEVTDRTAAINAEKSAREAAITAEEQARIDAVNAEASARTEVISAEAQAREAKDNELANSITNLTNSTNANVADLDGRLQTLEGKAPTWDAVEQNAKDYADSLASNYDAAGAADQALESARAYTDTNLDVVVKFATTFSYNIGEENSSKTIQEMFDYIATLEARIKALEEANSSSGEDATV